jgi:hypothetical protein
MPGPEHMEGTACGGKRHPASSRDAVTCVQRGTGASVSVQISGSFVRAENNAPRAASLRNFYKAMVMSVLPFGIETWSLEMGTLK